MVEIWIFLLPFQVSHLLFLRQFISWLVLLSWISWCLLTVLFFGLLVLSVVEHVFLSHIFVLRDLVHSGSHFLGDIITLSQAHSHVVLTTSVNQSIRMLLLEKEVVLLVESCFLLELLKTLDSLHSGLSSSLGSSILSHGFLVLHVSLLHLSLQVGKLLLQLSKLINIFLAKKSTLLVIVVLKFLS